MQRLNSPSQTPTFRLRLIYIFVTLMVLGVSLMHLSANADVERNWSDPTVWSGSPPTTASNVTLPENTTVVVDVPSIQVESITIPATSTLRFSPQNVSIRTRHIVVHGAFEMGTAAAPYTHQGNLTFFGDDTSMTATPDAGIMNVGTKGLFVMAGGRLDLHGDAPSLTWTRLGDHANAGDTQVTLAENPDWQAGDEIVIASTSFDYQEKETFSIIDIAGSTVTLDRPVEHFHFGKTQTYAGKTAENRAEVGLLNRNIRIQGEMTTAAPTFGVHTMFMEGSTIRIDGVEVINGGQEGMQGRYPLHFHLAGDMNGAYVRNSSVHQSFQRGITIHGTDRVLVQNNVFHDVPGHTVFLEDAVERFNTIERNLVVGTHTPDVPLITSDVINGFGPASFWIPNPNNVLKGNVAAGSAGTGFWYDLKESPTGVSAGVPMTPQQESLGGFDDNVAHSNGMFGLFIEPYFPPQNFTIHNNVMYKNKSHGIWITGNGVLLGGGIITIENSSVLDNGTGIIMPGMGMVNNTLYVGTSANANDGVWNDSKPQIGHRFYDGPMTVQNSTFVNYQPNSEFQSGAFSWRVNLAEGRNVGNSVENIEFINANELYIKPRNRTGPTSIGFESLPFEDRDGSFGGAPFSVISSEFPLVFDDTLDVGVQEWNGYIVSDPIGMARIACNGDTCPTTIIRDDGARETIGADGRFNLRMNRAYTIYRNDTACDFEVALNHEYAGDWAEIATPYSCTLDDVGRIGGGVELTEASSYSEMQTASQGSKYFYDRPNQMLYFRLYQPKDNFYEDIFVSASYDAVRVFGSGTNVIVDPPAEPPPPPEDDTLTLADLYGETTTDTALQIDVASANSSLIEADWSTLTISELPYYGQANVDGTSTVAYTPNGSYTGMDYFTYSLCDTAGICGQGSGSVSVVEPAGDTPTPGDGSTATISGELKRWHRVTLTFDGDNTSEDATVNPFTDYNLTVTFTNGNKTYTVPGFYAADGDAANTSATSGNKWRVHFTPDTMGTWTYETSFLTGSMVALNPGAGTPTGFHGATGSFTIAETDKPATDFRSQGLLRYVNDHYLQFAGSGEYFLKSGADSPENFLGYVDFDGTQDLGNIPDGNFLHTYAPHAMDWQPGDPLWAGDRGRGIIGALNYLSSQGVNSVYFLTYNIDGGDGADTWPWTSPDVRDRFDVSKLAQWEIVFSHMTAKGIQLHFVTQETENDQALGAPADPRRQLYYREMIARFGHHPALQWNLGEENSNSPEEREAFAQFIRNLDPYNHPITVHTNYNIPYLQYDPHYGSPYFEATSIQGDADRYNEWALQLRENSANGGRPWAIYGDEQGPQVASNMGNVDELRRDALWGNLMGGGAGVEWYFGYQGDFGDVQQEDFRTAQPLWEDSHHAVWFFQTYLPFEQMTPNNAVASGSGVLAMEKPGEIYVIYLPFGGEAGIDLPDTNTYSVMWYDPRSGGTLQTGDTPFITGAGSQSLGSPPSEFTQDWVVLIRQSDGSSPTNRPPNLDTVDDTSVVIGEELTIALNAFDPDGDTLEYALELAPDFIELQTLQNNNATLSAFPPDGSEEKYDVMVSVTDPDGLSDSESFTLTVTSADDPPPPSGDVPYVRALVLVDADSDEELRTLSDGETIYLNTLPSDNISIRAVTMPEPVGSVRFSVDDNNNFSVENQAPYALAGDSGGNYTPWDYKLKSYTIGAVPYDEPNGSGAMGDGMTINVVISNDEMQPTPTPTSIPDVNTPPAIQSPGNQTSTVNQSSSLQISASDPEGESLVYQATNLPSGLSINSTSGFISGTPTTVETKSVTLTVTDTDGAQDSLQFSWTIQSEQSATMAVTGFMLVNADTNRDIRSLTSNSIINLSELPTRNLNVRASTSGGVKSVRFAYNGNSNYRVENQAPHALAGDSSGNYNRWNYNLGAVTLEATPYANSGASGTRGESLRIQFTIQDSGSSSPSPTATPLPAPSDSQITSFLLINAEANTVIGPLANNAVVDLSDLGTNKLNIVAQVSGSVESVQLRLNREMRVENEAPYTMFGDQNGNYHSWDAKSGNYTLSATPFSQDGANGNAGTSLNIQFRIRN